MESLKTYNTTKELIISATVPAQTRTYKPVSHASLIDLTMDGIEKSGFTLGKATYSAARDGQIANGKFTITNIADGEMELQIGWQNSYNKSLSLKFAIGTRITVCSNGCVSGDFGAFKKKHRGDVQNFTPSAITEYIKRAGDVFQQIQRDRESLKQIEVTKRMSAELVGRMYLEEEIIQNTQLNIIKREMSNPSFDYGAEGSLWELYNHTTLALKEIHPSLWMDSHTKAHSFFVNASGLFVPSSVIDVPEPGALQQLELFNN